MGQAKPVSQFIDTALKFQEAGTQNAMREQQMRLDKIKEEELQQKHEQLYKPQNIRNSVLTLSLPEDKREAFVKQYIDAGYGDKDGMSNQFQRDKFLGEHKEGVDYWFNSKKDDARRKLDKAYQAQETSMINGDVKGQQEANKKVIAISAYLASLEGKHGDASKLLKGSNPILKNVPGVGLVQVTPGEDAESTTADVIQASESTKVSNEYSTFIAAEKEKDPNVTNVQLDKRWMERQRVVAQGKAETAAGVGKFSDKAMNVMVDNYMVDGTIPSFGFSAVGASQRKAFYDAVADRRADVGDTAGAQAARKANIQADSSSLRNAKKIYDMMDSYVRNMNAQVDRMDVILQDVTRLEPRLLNVPIRKWAMSVKGTAAESKVSMYTTEISNEIGKLSTGSAASVQELSQTAQQKWDKIHDPNLNVRELMSLLKETKHAGTLRMTTAKEVIDAIGGRIRGGGEGGGGGGGSKDPLGLGL
jgi:hypothetical protein